MGSDGLIGSLRPILVVFDDSKEEGLGEQSLPEVRPSGSNPSLFEEGRADIGTLKENVVEEDLKIEQIPTDGSVIRGEKA